MCYNITVEGITIPETAIAYAAGIMDGEGYITIRRYPMRSGRYTFALRANVSNTDLKMVEFIHQYFGGTLTQHKTITGRPIYYISWSSNRARTLLIIIKPYLITKRKLAEYGIEFQDLINSKDRRTLRLTEDEFNARDALYNLVSANQLRTARRKSG